MEYGVSKFADVVFVAIPPKKSALYWVWPAIHDDILRRRQDNKALSRRTIISSSLHFDVDNPRDMGVIDDFAVGVTNAMKAIINVLWVPVIQSVGGLAHRLAIEELRGRDSALNEWRERGTWPAVWAKHNEGLPLLFVGGSNLRSLLDYSNPSVREFVRMDSTVPADVYARSSMVNCAGALRRQKFVIDYGSNDLATAAAAGVILDVIRMENRQNPSKYNARSNDGSLIAESLNSSELFEDYILGGRYSWVRKPEEDNRLKVHVIWNGLNGRKPRCLPAQKRHLQERAPLGCEADDKDENNLMTEIDNTGPHTIVGDWLSQHQSTTPTLPPSPSKPPIAPTATGALSCSTSTRGQKTLPPIYATRAVENFCSSSSRAAGLASINTQYPTANYGPPPTNNRCFSLSPCTVEVVLDKAEPAAAQYNAWPTQVCGETLYRIHKECKGVGGHQKVGLFDFSVTVAECLA